MSAARAKEEKPPAGPDELVRTAAGAYRSGDGRFEVQKSDVGWYLVDTHEVNEFGQQLIHGPLATLEAIRVAIPGARDIKPLLRVRPPSSRKRSSATESRPISAKSAPPQPPPPRPRSWLDELPDKEAGAARRLIRALEREGLDDADGLVRSHRDDTAVIATHLIEHRLRALIDEQPEHDRERAQKLVRSATKLLAEGGAAMARPAPRWALVEVVEADGVPERRITPRV